MNQKIFYLLAISLSIFSCKTTQDTSINKEKTIVNTTTVTFDHGVASGDPLNDRVIIWTKATPSNQEVLMVEWVVATDENMETPVKYGFAQTDQHSDYTVKVDVEGLNPNTTYYYQFKSLGSSSIVGRTKTTAKEGQDAVKLAIISCSNFEAGYYNALARVAERTDIDAVVHLGDYIYEYAPGTYGDTTLGPSRTHVPAKEIIDLGDYRMRYAQYRMDPDFQKVHQAHPFITIWDDHEFANNVYQSGAQNHQEEEGSFTDRRAAAKQAYFEWLPVRDNEGQNIYRTIQFGDVVDLIMLDERIAGRTMPVDSASQANFQAKDRSMLGAEQLAWFKEQLSESKATWKVIGNQVIFSLMDLSWRNPQSPYNLDAWDGYPYEQSQLTQFLATEKITNTIFTTGDTHCSWAFEVPSDIAAYKENSSANTVAIEFGTPSVTSANFNESTPADQVLEAEKVFVHPNFNPHLKYVNLRDHGYLLLTLNQEVTIAEWYYVDQIKERTSKEQLAKRYVVKSGSNQLSEK